MHMCGMCMRVCVRACVRACVHVYMHVYPCVCVCALRDKHKYGVCGSTKNRRHAWARNQGRAAESEASKRKSRGRGKTRQDGARGWAYGKTGRDNAR